MATFNRSRIPRMRSGMVKELTRELPQALKRGEIIPYYQPLVDLQTEQIQGFELLARWRHQTGQLIPPNEFIPIAEQTGLIAEITQSLLRQACRAAGDWAGDFRLFVNISSTQLGDPELSSVILQITEETRFPVNRLTLEITEGAEIKDFDRVSGVVESLKSLGVRFALDDFGTAYSGLRHLQMLPFDALKLDAAFVQNMTKHRESRKIVAAVIGLCHSLGVDSVAEGIENHSQLEMLRSLGYGSGQGWLFGRPAPTADATAVLGPARQTTATQLSEIAEQVALRLEALPIQSLWQVHALYEGSSVGLAFVDPNLHYLAVNERLAEMHGIPVTAFPGRSVRDAVPQLVGQIEPKFRRALTGEPVFDSESFWRLDDGKRKWVLQASYHPVRDSMGQVVGVSVAVVDVTEAVVRRAAEGLHPYDETVLRRA